MCPFCLWHIVVAFFFPSVNEQRDTFAEKMKLYIYRCYMHIQRVFIPRSSNTAVLSENQDKHKVSFGIGFYAGR